MIPFRLDVPEAELERLRERLRTTRWPEAETVADWSQGVPLAFVRELCAYWADGYDWRATEARLNAVPQFHTRVDGLDIHFLHARSPHDAALPLVLTHGWPGSVVEFLDVIGPLTDPPAFGGDAADAFHVVCPSLPGYGFSAKPTRTGWGIERIADAWATLMSELGHRRYGAAGHDWGTSVSTLLGVRDADHVAGIHLIPPLAPPDPATFDDLTDAERRALLELDRAAADGDGYSFEQRTRPQTIGYGLVDSPAALCAWIVEKFHAWSDRAIDRDRLLDNLMLYWLPGTGASAARLYWESFATVQQWFTAALPEPVPVPAGCSIFARELPRPSRRWAERRFTDIRYWNELDRGGHFAALEEPAAFVDELRSFFRLVRRP
ncbi:pimeloyl-ACP methyl ester carboxylesterase [Allocatelliglobosispora scoriae]|uniref:Pimeloyl-ACP methyl ester carboxylesterase n=1 Tax=Allocatelliglobosispora scoriae TaxID=643052 RepID=A0A841BI51_9ACTN|nr:epoxide hydrolase family protein [Allocatelliglobosispora scoriae]MBB5866849.1 pimeloyl-ACP methyl ester carboxylesterase [Allocatelliglobosispora scoriae]